MSPTKTPEAGFGRRRFFWTGVGATAAGLLAPNSAAAVGRRPALLSGAGAPSGSRGRVGDFYFDIRSGQLYGPKRKRTTNRRKPWGRPINLRMRPGSDGARGPTGPAGEVGPTGPTGPRGFSVLTSVGPPDPSLGIDGDFCIDVASTQIYGPKEDGVWGSPTNLVGAPDERVFGSLAAAPESLLVGDIVRNADGVVTEADVAWPDGTPGRYSATPSQDVPGAADSYTITYGDPVIRTYRQDPVTRNARGAVTFRPAIQVVTS